ncbi:hypothetical protein BD324DRAFT_650686 [Kockovaella imperatae]|uniref:Uncharacterized protein n=1 Tax=Kockovaella imperatae TaxID=4999 RepID=A0A1Y1UG79_9TREE|nr:hypothetical protein BD324DRAFT_650686 [Kockovaella imperatae]ORX37071.1 hypothetical protein BD324DRAFT_650686 [Kockovaella imperatae]
MLAPLALLAYLVQPISAQDQHGWQCDVRAWTRAPDLYPGGTVPGEARLTLNGTECYQVESWTLGLRMAERVILKRRAAGSAELPTKPSTSCDGFQCIHAEQDWNDIFRSADSELLWQPEFHDPVYYSAVMEYGEYRCLTIRQLLTALAEKNLRNQSLWNVTGLEREIFDLHLALPFEHELSGDVNLDVVQPFVVHVPYTNFPPSQRYERIFEHRGYDQQVYASESEFIYYHNLTLTNGSSLMIPAGITAFLPAPAPVSMPASHVAENMRSASDSESVILRSPFGEVSERAIDFGRMEYGRPRPACDAGNISHFEVSISAQTVPVQGRNVTLAISVVKVGNGSEYPISLDVQPAIDHQMEWLGGQFEDEDHYRAFLAGDGDGLNVREPRSWNAKMLMVKPDWVLEEERRKRQDRRACPWSFGPTPAALASHSLENISQSDEGAWRFELQFPIPHDTMPTFSRTFDNLRSMLAITLTTRFGCEDQETSAMKNPNWPPHENQALSDLDDDWLQYELPPLTSQDEDTSDSFRQTYRHRASVPLDVVRANDESIPVSAHIKHYSDPIAQAPVLALSPVVNPSFGPVNHVKRRESAQELRIGRYDHRPRLRFGWCRSDPSHPLCWDSNLGGLDMHAGMVWRTKEARIEEQREAGKVNTAFVVQT